VPALGGGVTECELFRSPNLLVRQVGGHGDVCIVTFGFHTPEGTLERPGFGEAFLRDAGIAAIHVLSVDNRWYQYPEIDQALEAVAKGVAGFARTISYGCSMGGYAALRFARACGAHQAIAISPQYSIDPKRPPFDRRWRAEARETGFVEPRYAPPANAILVYDPDHALDRAHAALYLAAPGAIDVPVRFSGHPSAALLAELGLLQALVRQVAAGTFDAAAFQREVRALRRRSAHYHFVLAHRLQYRHPGVAMALLRRALDIERLPHLLSTLGAILDRQGASGEAGPLHREAVAMAPDNAESIAWLAWHLALCGQSRAGRAAIDEAVRERGLAPSQRMRTVRAHLVADRCALGLYFPLLKLLAKWRNAPLTPAREFWARRAKS
jgi:hypothetical protein